MVSDFVVSLIHGAITTAAVYVPAYTMGATLNKTLLVLFVTMIALSFILKQVTTSKSAMPDWLTVALGVVPWVLMGLKFGLAGVLGFLGIGVLAAVATVLIDRL
jgi:hypothetical protein